MKNSDSSTIDSPNRTARKACSDTDHMPASENPVDLTAENFSKTARKNIKKMAKRLYVGDSPIHGKGLFARKPIKAGAVLGRLHGLLTESEGTHVLWLNKNLGIELTNEFRFINHDSNPNCAIVETEVITLRAVEADEELTHDYGW